MNMIDAKKIGLDPPEAETIKERITKANGPLTVNLPWGGPRRRSEMTRYASLGSLLGSLLGCLFGCLLFSLADAVLRSLSSV